ncbi:FAD-dependent oxidoreductase [Formosa haliotis]|uniref:FAD-dependent oxidoreductase n=1 Tax=Formosa haliotis TaxID=1555194 RepID=UPI0008267D73|nr:FAD-dependent oxidoreductase [Formosa haliotis]
MIKSTKQLFYFSFISMLFTVQVIGQTPQENTNPYDLVIVGGTPSGIMAAIAASRAGKNSIIIERSKHIGGLPANGLGATDIQTRGAVGGLFKTFVSRIEKHYIDTYGKNSKQVKDCSNGYHFEPSVAEAVLEQMISEHPSITVLKYHQFDVNPKNITVENNRVRNIKILNRATGHHQTITGLTFIDATYEGDLIAAAGIPYLVGREGQSEYNEKYAGKVYKYWEGPIGAGSTFEKDTTIQAFNYRLCLTTNPDNFVAIKKPSSYNRDDYTSLIQDVVTGKYTGHHYFNYLKHHAEPRPVLNHPEQSSKPKVPGAPEGINRLVNKITIPNSKTDANNQHLAFISTDLPEENWKWPEASWKWRDTFANRLKDYTLGLLWFAQHDEELPDWFKNECLKWGLAKDEYVSNDNFPRQVYVREGRRMQGSYFFTAHDALPTAKDKRPPLHANSISAGHYSIDSHGVRKREDNRVHLDGFISYATEPFTIPYGVIVPKTIENVLAPVPISGSHLGFSAIRMEPTWMALGEAAGLASVISINDQTPVQSISIKKLQNQLLENNAVLIYFKDISKTDTYYKAIQFLGLEGVFTDWKANPNKKIHKKDIEKACKNLNLDPTTYYGKKMKRYEFAERLYKDYYQIQ